MVTPCCMCGCAVPAQSGGALVRVVDAPVEQPPAAPGLRGPGTGAQPALDPTATGPTAATGARRTGLALPGDEDDGVIVRRDDGFEEAPGAGAGVLAGGR